MCSFPPPAMSRWRSGQGASSTADAAASSRRSSSSARFSSPGARSRRSSSSIYYPAENSFSIFSRANDSSEDLREDWLLHATGKMRAAERAEPPAAEPRDAILGRCTRAIDGAEVYPWLAECGLQYGPAFQGIKRVWGGEGEALGEVKRAGAGDFLIHPALLDSCFQVIFAALGEAAPRGGVFLPVMIGRFRLHKKPEGHLWSHVRITRRTAKVLEADIRLTDDGEDGDEHLVAEIHGLRCQAVEGMRPHGESLDELFYETRWLAQPLEGTVPPGADFLPDTRKLGVSLRREAKRLGRDLRTTARDAAFHERRMRLETGYIIAALGRLGWDPRPGDEVTLPGLMAQLCVLPKYERLLGRYLGLLAEDGLLERRGAGWLVLEAAPMLDLDREWRALIFDQPTLQPDYALIDRCGRALAEVLHGETDPLHLLFPDGGMDTLDHFYSSGEGCRLSNLLARAAMEACVAALPEGRPLRILEIGAGTGGLTANLLPVLPPGQAEYVFTDISKLFLPRAEQRAKDYPFLKTAVLDIEQDPLGQGFAAHSFDIVAASNALHATADLRATLRHIRSLLAPDGLLMLIEIDRPSRGFDFMFGTIDGYWRFTDFDLRPDYSLLNPGQWRALLKESGFHDAAAVSDKPGKTVLRQTLLLARGPSVPERDMRANGGADGDTWILLADRGGVAEELAECFREHGSRCVLVFPGADPRAALADLAENDQPARGVAHSLESRRAPGGIARLRGAGRGAGAGRPIPR